MPVHAPAALALLLLLGTPSGAAAHEDEDAYIEYDDVMVPLDRHYRGLGGTSVGQDQLWRGGRVNFFIDTEGTHSHRPAPPHDAADVDMILRAVAHWEEKTCVRFKQCSSESSCGLPYIRFRSAKDTCSSPMGTWGRVNTIYMGKGCGFGAAVHEIGHSMGLVHTQSRNDRDEYVQIHLDQVEELKEHNFRTYGSSGRSIGAYDYSSIMHYRATAFATGSLPTITAPVAIGQRSGLSVGDVAAIHFLYNDCKAFDAPRCIASKDASVTHVIPYGAPFEVEFNGVYSSYMTVDYDGTTAPAAQTTQSPRADSEKYKQIKAEVAFTPVRADSGKTFTLAARFTRGSLVAECSVEVQVAPAETVCHGLPGNDPDVCSGRGTCTDEPVFPCACDAGAAGPQCEGYPDCLANVVHNFDDEEDLAAWFISGDAAIDRVLKVSGDGAWKHTASYAQLQLPGLSKPEVVSYDFAWSEDGGRASLTFGGESRGYCFFLGVAWGRQYASSGARGEYGEELEAGRYYHIEHRINWEARTVDHYVDGRLAFSDLAFDSSCSTGIRDVTFWGPGWLDTFDLHCTDHTPGAIGATPRTPAPPTPPTPSPPTPVPTTPVPTTAVPPTPAPACQDEPGLVEYCKNSHYCKYPSFASDCPLSCGKCSTVGTPAPTPAPTTSIPPTPAPSTSVPDTPAPSTSAPPTPAPSTSAPETPTPETPEPPTRRPTPPPTPPPVTAEPPTTACVDLEGWCPSRATLCKYSSVRDLCPLTCGVCA